jgi:hypothetical protein
LRFNFGSLIFTIIWAAWGHDDVRTSILIAYVNRLCLFSLLSLFWPSLSTCWWIFGDFRFFSSALHLFVWEIYAGDLNWNWFYLILPLKF